MTITDIPLSVYNRALEIYGTHRYDSKTVAKIALAAVKKRIDVPVKTSVQSSLTPFATALAEYMSRSGPWADGGEFFHEFPVNVGD